MNAIIEPEPEVVSQEAVVRLTADLKQAVEKFTPREVRFTVDTFYTFQENRKRAANQMKALNKAGEPHRVIDWLTTNSRFLENQIKAALNVYAKSQPMGRWAYQIYGIGPVLTAGLLAHFDINKAPTYGHYWSFAGLTTGFNSPVKWNKGEVRPWNAKLKMLCWKIGDVMVKFSAKPECFYGQLYAEKKLELIAQNESGQFADAASDGTTRVSPTTDAWKWYAGCYIPAETVAYRDAVMAFRKWESEVSDEVSGEEIEAKEKELETLKPKAHKPGEGVPMLPPAHVDARARRYVIKLFISHWWEEAYKQRWGKEPPPPYPISHKGHAHIIKSPVPSLATMSE